MHVRFMSEHVIDVGILKFIEIEFQVLAQRIAMLQKRSDIHWSLMFHVFERSGNFICF